MVALDVEHNMGRCERKMKHLFGFVAFGTLVAAIWWPVGRSLE